MQKLLIPILLGSLFYACSDTEEPVDCDKTGPIISLGTVVNATSCSVADGSIRVSATGGVEPYTFSVNDQAGQSTGEFDNLHAGIYSVHVEDSKGCSKSVDNVSIKAADFSFAADITPDDDCLSGNGAVVINVAAGNPPYTYRLGNGSFTDNNTFTGLSIGTYAVSVKDNNDCSVLLSVTVPRGFTGVSWENEIKPIMDKSCALSGCHNGSSRPDLRLFENAKFYATSIKSKTRDKSMPREGSLTQQQIDIISCWVDDGAVQN